MDPTNAIKVFQKLKGKLIATQFESVIITCNDDALKLVRTIFGDKNNHFNVLSSAKLLTADIQKEVIINEIDSIISEFESKATVSSVFRPLGNADVPDKSINKQEIGSNTPKKFSNDLKKIFVVHGHDEEMKQAVARVLEKLNLEPIILHEKPDQNKTIIEKFVIHSDVDYAIILLSPDDFAYPKEASYSEGKYRARQNAILELGYFLGKLGRERVFVLYRQDGNFEIPSDYLGVLYTLYDKSRSWQYKLADELRVIDPKIDKNNL